MERELREQLEQQLYVLSRYMNTTNLTNIYNRLQGRLIEEYEVNQYVNLVNNEYNRLISDFNTFATRAVVDTTLYSQSATYNYIVNNNLLPYEKAFNKEAIDRKTANVLIKNMQTDFGVVANQGKEYFRSYIQFSKQGLITESQIDKAVLKGYIEKGTSKGAKKVLKEYFDTAIDELIYGKINKDTNLFRKLKFEEINKKKVSDVVKLRLKAEFEEKLKDDKFLFLINKNGDPMVFKVKTYSDLVARTRLGEAQVSGTIEQGIANGMQYFKVTAHGTKTPICMPYENKILTTKRNDENGYEYMSKSNTPLYHINCQHRLIPTIRDSRGGLLL